MGYCLSLFLFVLLFFGGGNAFEVTMEKIQEREIPIKNLSCGNGILIEQEKGVVCEVQRNISTCIFPIENVYYNCTRKIETNTLYSIDVPGYGGCTWKTFYMFELGKEQAFHHAKEKYESRWFAKHMKDGRGCGQGIFRKRGCGHCFDEVLFVSMLFMVIILTMIGTKCYIEKRKERIREKEAQEDQKRENELNHWINSIQSTYAKKQKQTRKKYLYSLEMMKNMYKEKIKKMSV